LARQRNEGNLSGACRNSSPAVGARISNPVPPFVNPYRTAKVYVPFVS
jgi:hypothetical protein